METEDGRISVSQDGQSWFALTNVLADAFVPTLGRIYTPDENIQGYELEATENLSTYSLASVTGQVYVDE